MAAGPGMVWLDVLSFTKQENELHRYGGVADRMGALPPSVR